MLTWTNDDSTKRNLQNWMEKWWNDPIRKREKVKELMLKIKKLGGIFKSCVDSGIYYTYTLFFILSLSLIVDADCKDLKIRNS
jgi:hypothetical protein